MGFVIKRTQNKSGNSLPESKFFFSIKLFKCQLKLINAKSHQTQSKTISIFKLSPVASSTFHRLNFSKLRIFNYMEVCLAALRRYQDVNSSREFSHNRARDLWRNYHGILFMEIGSKKLSLA